MADYDLDTPYESGQQSFTMPPTAPNVVQQPNNTPPIAPSFALAGQAQAPDQNAPYNFGQNYQQAYQNGYSPAANPLNSPEINTMDADLYKKFARALDKSLDDKPSAVHNVAKSLAETFRGGALGAIAGSLAAATDRHELDRATALKGMNDIANQVNLANIKPAISAMQDQRKQYEQQIRQERNQNLKQHGEAMVQAKNWATMENARHHNMVSDAALQTLGMKREHFDRAFQQRNDFMARHEQIARDMANLQTAIKLHGYRQDWAMGLAKLRQQDVEDYGKMKMQEAKLNSAVSQRFAQAAAKGQPLIGPNGQPLRPEDLMVHYERQPIEEVPETDEEGIGEALSHVNREPDQEAVQPGQAAAKTAVKLPASQKANYQKLIGSGMNPEKAKMMFIQSAVNHGHSLEQAVEMAKEL